MSGSSKIERGKNASKASSPTALGSPIGISVVKRDGSIQPFDKNKLVNSIKNAGATQQQSSLIANRVVDRLSGFKQTVPSSQLSSMVARSLSKVNPVASGQYTSFRDQKLRSPIAPTAKGAAFRIGMMTTGPKPSITQATPQKIGQVAAAPKLATTPKIAASPTITAAKPVAIIAQAWKPKLPDLIIDQARIVEVRGPGQGTAVAGSDLLLGYTVKNIGDAPAVFEMDGSGNSRYAIASVKVLGYDKVYLLRDVFEYDGAGPLVIQPGESVNKNAFFGLQVILGVTVLAPGEYTVKVVANPEKAIAESNEQNNEYVVSFEVKGEPVAPGGNADLIVSDLQVITTADPYVDTFLEVTIKNIGTMGVDYVYLLNHPDWKKRFMEISGIGDYALDSTKDNVPRYLGPYCTFQLKYRTFIDMTPQTYTWIFKVNPQNVSGLIIPETNTDNNEATYQVVIGQNRAVLSINRI